MKNQNLQIYILENSIKELINKSNLSVGTVYFILKNFYQNIEFLYKEEIQKEFQLFNQQKEKEEKNSSQISQGQAD